MLLPSEIHRSEDLVGIAMPTVAPLASALLPALPALAPDSLWPHAARLSMATTPTATVRMVLVVRMAPPEVPHGPERAGGRPPRVGGWVWQRERQLVRNLEVCSKSGETVI